MRPHTFGASSQWQHQRAAGRRPSVLEPADAEFKKIVDEKKKKKAVRYVDSGLVKQDELVVAVAIERFEAAEDEGGEGAVPGRGLAAREVGQRPAGIASREAMLSDASPKAHLQDAKGISRYLPMLFQENISWPAFQLSLFEV